jgi:hypothetical protein
MGSRRSGFSPQGLTGGGRGTTGVIIIIAGRRMGDTPFPEVGDEAGRLGNFHWSYFSKI